MNVFIWYYVGDCGSGAYHSGGGLVVFASSVGRAIEVAESNGVKFAQGELTPSYVRYVRVGDDYDGEKFFRFPDAGCC
jgi:hypothetical protein